MPTQMPLFPGTRPRTVVSASSVIDNDSVDEVFIG